MDKPTPEAPERDEQSIARLIREFPGKIGFAVLNGLVTGMYVAGGGFAVATVVGILGNPIWRWGRFLWNLWP